MASILVATALLASTTASYAASPVSLWLMANGQQIKGDSSTMSFGRADTIECVQLELVGTKTAARQWEGVKCRKRIDKASPALLNAYASQQSLDATFRFYRPNPNGDGTTQQFYTIVLTQAHVAGVRMLLPDTLTPATANDPALEEVVFNFATIAITYTPTSQTFNDLWTR